MSKSNSPDHPTSIAKSEDQEQNRDVNALFSSFRVDQAGYRTFSRHRTPKPQEAEERAVAGEHHHAKRIAIYSPIGGSGKTTLAASLAAIFWQLGKKVLVVDASPWPTLAYHYGASTARAGLRSFFAPGNDVPVRILARDLNEPAALDIDASVAATPTDYVLFDLSGASSAELAGYLQQISVLIVPLVPELASARYAEAIQTFLGKLPHAPRQVLYVINQMEDTPVAKEVCLSLSQLLGDKLFQTPIYRQAEIQESLDEGIVLPIYAPEAQAVTVCNEIVRWIEAPKRTAPAKAQQRWSER